MDHAFERYVGSAGLFGTPESCLAQVDHLRSLGVDEIACLIDFGVDQDTVLAALEDLDELRRAANAGVGVVELPDGDLESAIAADEEVDAGFVAQVVRHAVTHVQCTPSMAAVIAADRAGLGALASLEQLLLGGEALPPPLVDEVRPAMRGRLLNMYGPTETTIWSTVSPIEAAGEPITIGRPIANTQVYIVDRELQLNPIGTAGELLIGGDGVVRGYLDRPELTAERFVDLPAAGGARVYRTGDLVTLLPDGELQFGGRLDHQVKVRGYRIELGEIEAVIGRFPNVRENVVVARTETPGDPRHRRLRRAGQRRRAGGGRGVGPGLGRDVRRRRHRRPDVRHLGLERQLLRRSDPGRPDARVGRRHGRPHPGPRPAAGARDRLRHRPPAVPSRPAQRALRRRRPRPARPRPHRRRPAGRRAHQRRAAPRRGPRRAVAGRRPPLRHHRHQLGRAVLPRRPVPRRRGVGRRSTCSSRAARSTSATFAAAISSRCSRPPSSSIGRRRR